MRDVGRNEENMALELPDNESMFPEEYQFNLSDFDLFLSVMKNPKAHRNVLSIIMNEPDLKPAEFESKIN